MSKKRVSPDSVIIDLTDLDDNDDQESRLGDIRRRLAGVGGNKAKRAKESVEDDFVRIIDTPAPKMKEKSTTTKETDDDVVLVGTVNEMRLPHMRQHCTQFKFKPIDFRSNEKHCDLCYCYVCDCPVSKCTVRRGCAIFVL